MNDRSWIVCAGLFWERHQAIYEHLINQYNIIVFETGTIWPGSISFFSKIPNIIRDRRPRKLVSLYESFLKEQEKRLNITGNKKTRLQVAENMARDRADGICIQKRFKRLHKKYGIKGLIVIGDYIAPFRALALEANEIGIPSCQLEHGYSLTNMKFEKFNLLPHYAPLVQHHFVDNTKVMQHFQDIESPVQPKFYAVGDYLDHQEYITDSQSTADRCKIIYSVCYGDAASIQEAIYQDQSQHQAFKIFCDLCEDLKNKYPIKSFEFVVKLHPGMTKDAKIDTSAYYRNKANERDIKITVSDSAIREWLISADLHISEDLSSTNHEAFLCKVPSISLVMTHNSKRYNNTELIKQSDQQIHQIVIDHDQLKDKSVAFLEQKWSGEFNKICDQIKLEPKNDINEACTNIMNEIKDIFV